MWDWQWQWWHNKYTKQPVKSYRCQLQQHSTVKEVTVVVMERSITQHTMKPVATVPCHDAVAAASAIAVNSGCRWVSGDSNRWHTGENWQWWRSKCSGIDSTSRGDSDWNIQTNKQNRNKSSANWRRPTATAVAFALEIYQHALSVMATANTILFDKKEATINQRQLQKQAETTR